MKFSKWHIAPAEEADIRRLGEAGYPQLVSQVLAARSISTAEEAAAFLERGRDLTCSPFLMKDMDRAVECISRAIGQGLRMAVFGDYDVDGITATVILVDYLKSRGVDVLHYIPRRIEDGYGLGQDAIRSLHEQGVELLITVDCGITGVEEVDFAASLGMDVVITDHHECKDTLPRAVAVVDPHRPDCTYPFPYLAGCGVALKLVLALGGESREEALFSRYCTLAAIGTIAASSSPVAWSASLSRTSSASTPCCRRQASWIRPSPPCRWASCWPPASTPLAAWGQRTRLPTSCCVRTRRRPPGWPVSCAL